VVENGDFSAFFCTADLFYNRYNSHYSAPFIYYHINILHVTILYTYECEVLCTIKAGDLRFNMFKYDLVFHSVHVRL